MSWSNGLRRRSLALAALAALAIVPTGCGFRPLYGETPSGAAASDDLAAIDVGIIADRRGQQLRNFLLERLNPAGRPTEPRFRLEVSISESLGAYAVLQDDTVSRYNLYVVARFQLLDVETEDELLERASRATASYNVLDDQYATLASERSARDRALEAISDDIRTQLALYFQRDGA